MSWRPTRRPPVLLAEGDACGCAMGAKFLGVGLVSSIAWLAWHHHTHALHPWSVCWRVLLTAFLFATLGKLVGMLVFRLRQRSAPRPAL
jgi:hypothetical protein